MKCGANVADVTAVIYIFLSASAVDVLLSFYTYLIHKYEKKNVSISVERPNKTDDELA